MCLCVCLCLSAAVRPHYCTDPDVTWGHGRGCPLVVHYWADLQSGNGLRCYGNITRTLVTAAAWTAGFLWWRSGNKKRTQNVSEYMLVLALCLVLSSVVRVNWLSNKVWYTESRASGYECGHRIICQPDSCYIALCWFLWLTDLFLTSNKIPFDFDFDSDFDLISPHRDPVVKSRLPQPTVHPRPSLCTKKIL